MPATQRALTPKQAAFAKAYVRGGGNGAKAAREAGYSSGNGVDKQVASENLAKPYVAAAIAKETKRAIDAANLRPEDIVNGLLKEAGLKGKKPKDSMQGGRVRALELCGKTFALFADRTITNEVEVIGARDLVLKLALDTPTAAIGMAIDLCVADFEMCEALKPESPDVSARLAELLASDAKLLHVDLDLPIDAESDENAGESPEAGS